MRTFWNAVSEANRLWCWKMKPILRRTAISSRGPAPWSVCPSTSTDPSCTVRSVPMRVKSVVLPPPDGPVMMTISPGGISRLLSKRTWLRSAPWPKWCCKLVTRTA